MLILDGQKISKKILRNLHRQILSLKRKDKEVVLAAVLIGDDSSSLIYVRAKKKACEKVGIKFIYYHLDKDVSEDEILSLIKKLNLDPKISGILVQLPLPSKISQNKVVETIAPEKDIDGFRFILKEKSKFLPPTPLGILKLFQEYKITLKNKSVVIVGSGFLVGRPLSEMLKDEGALVTIVDKKTENIGQFTKSADILISAAGVPNLIKKDMIKEGAAVVDVGNNRIKVRGKNRVIGDVDFEGVSEKVAAITPVPGGVGPMTVAVLLENVVKAAKN